MVTGDFQRPSTFFFSSRSGTRDFMGTATIIFGILNPYIGRKSFQGSQGRAYLFNSVVNVGCGPAEERVLLTGLHAVADIYCENCKTTLGWKYEHAFESSQKYKEGKFIIELAHMIKDNGWE
ncbi:protein yippee-like 1 isoform X1 [Sceloporus undulatus]|uniref:protein yippee-like 1 isoform X1 n=1 Tax=Sceloporus undulatus TaxID=8520 RepID=UPI001C4D7854|nr:protein yippee-like 1 isoform X1 [Sceloporus undulatus]